MSEATVGTLEIETRENVLWVTLNRPEVKNAMSEQTIQELYDCFSNLDQNLRAVVLRGNGDFFCSGADINWMKAASSKTPEENDADTLMLAKMLRSIDETPCPLITVVKGGAFGGGVGLVAASDIVLADEKASFSLSEVKLGLIPATIGPLVLRKVGYSQARRLYLTGKRFSAEEACQIGLAHAAVPASSLHVMTLDYLKLIGSSGPHAVKKAKILIRHLSAGEAWKPDACEVTSRLLSEMRVTEEAKEGIAAFLEKRKANWVSKLS